SDKARDRTIELDEDRRRDLRLVEVAVIDRERNCSRQRLSVAKSLKKIFEGKEGITSLVEIGEIATQGFRIMTAYSEIRNGKAMQHEDRCLRPLERKQA